MPYLVELSWHIRVNVADQLRLVCRKSGHVGRDFVDGNDEGTLVTHVAVFSLISVVVLVAVLNLGQEAVELDQIRKTFLLYLLDIWWNLMHELKQEDAIVPVNLQPRVRISSTPSTAFFGIKLFKCTTVARTNEWVKFNDYLINLHPTNLLHVVKV